MLSQLKTRWTIHRADLGADFTAAFTTGVASIPDSMASALLAGISPLTGLYTMIVATPIGALFTSSEMMHVSTTSALSLAVGSSLLGVPPASRLQSVFLLAFMVGVIQIGMGLLKMGFLVRFVPHSVMTGFLNGVALLIILGQLTDFTGYDSPLSNRVAQALDTLLNLREVVLPVLLVWWLMGALIILLGRTRCADPGHRPPRASPSPGSRSRRRACPVPPSGPAPGRAATWPAPGCGADCSNWPP